MTFGIYFRTEHAMLWHVRYALSNYPAPASDAYLAAGSACVLACQAALEAIVNRLLEQQGKLRHWDQLKLTAKIDTLADFGGQQVVWGAQPWQEITRLIRTRNWLTHSKSTYIGLIGSAGEWVVDAAGRLPKLNPEDELREDSIRRFYNAVREAGLLLSSATDAEAEFAFLTSEKYEPVIAG